jgi:catechol 2,3-dioxygenase-like lactoylglutathione lyase family enzyme
MIALADVAVSVSNAKSSAQWWTEKLGFVAYTMGGSGHATLVAPPGDAFVLHLCEGIEPVDPGNTGIAFLTDDLPGLVDRMQSSGVKFPKPIEGEGLGARAWFEDPDGNVFWLLGAPRSFIEKELGRRAPGGSVPRPRPGRPGNRKKKRRAR